MLTTKTLPIKTIIHELLWMLSGDTNTKYLKDNKVNIWNAWEDSKGNLGQIYGKQWRNFSGVDQIKEAVHLLKTAPYSRRNLVSCWNPGELPEMRLAPCHCLFQLSVHDNRLSCQLYQRSADVFLGVPFNTVFYAVLTKLFAQVCDLVPHEFIHTFGDVHLYSNHIEQAKTQLGRSPRNLPNLLINSKIKDIFGFSIDDFVLENYNPHPHIYAKVSV